MAEKTILEIVRDYVSAPDDSYDQTLLIHINAVMFGLSQLGVVTLVTVDATTVWSILSVAVSSMSEVVKQILCLRVKYMFDATGSQQVSLFEAINEFESRLVVAMDTTPAVVPPVVP